MFGKKKTMVWSHVKKITFDPTTMYLIIHGENQKIRCYLWIRHFKIFVRLIQLKTGIHPLDMGLPKKLCEEIEETALTEYQIFNS